jgi:hypothetical protein
MEGREALASLPAQLATLPPHRLAGDLRRTYPPHEASALAEQVGLRAKASERFGAHRDLVYSPAGLEMMTHPVVATRRGGRLAALDVPAADLTCGIGGDLRAMLDAGIRAAGIDNDQAAAILAAANTGGAAARGDAARPPVAPDAAAVMLDPSRRSGATRRFDPAAFSPRWDTCLELAREARAAVIKGPPGIDTRHTPPDAEVEFVQLGRTLRECTLWFGGESQPGLRRAVLLDGHGREVALDSSAPESPTGWHAPAHFVFDPESCVTRAGLVRHLAHVLSARLMDEQLAYLSAPEPASHPMAATFEVLDTVPFSVARLRVRLRERGWRPDEIRRRAFPVEPDELRRLLGRLEGERVTLLCTTIAGNRVVFVARRLAAAQA